VVLARTEIQIKNMKEAADGVPARPLVTSKTLWRISCEAETFRIGLTLALAMFAGVHGPNGGTVFEVAPKTGPLGAGEVDKSMLNIGANQFDAEFVSDVEALCALRQ